MTTMIISNLAGTMSESFAIGKRGIKLLQGTAAPTGLQAPSGSIYIMKGETGQRVYQVNDDGVWSPLLTTDDIEAGGGVALTSNGNGGLVISASPNGDLIAGNSATISLVNGFYRLDVDAPLAGNGIAVATDGNGDHTITAKPPVAGNNIAVSTELDGTYKIDGLAPLAGNGITISDVNGRAMVSTVNTFFKQTFTAANLTNGVLTVTHNLGEEFPAVFVYNNNRSMIIPDGVTSVDANTMTVNLVSFRKNMTGNWTVSITK